MFIETPFYFTLAPKSTEKLKLPSTRHAMHSIPRTAQKRPRINLGRISIYCARGRSWVFEDVAHECYHMMEFTKKNFSKDCIKWFAELDEEYQYNMPTKAAKLEESLAQLMGISAQVIAEQMQYLEKETTCFRKNLHLLRPRKIRLIKEPRECYPLP